MDNNKKEAELEEGEINDLEDGEIEDDETPETLVKTPLLSEPPQQILQSSDFPRPDNAKTGNFRGGNFNYFNPQRPKPTRRRDVGLCLRFIEGESRFLEREGTRMRTRPSFHHDVNNVVNSPRQTNTPWKKGMARTSPNLPSALPPLMHGRPISFPPQSRARSPPASPDADNLDDFDLLLERHKQIQLQLDRLEREESAAILDNEDFIDDSFVDIPVDADMNNASENIIESNLVDGTSEIKNDKEQSLPKSFEPFKIKPLRPPVPTLKELSNRQRPEEMNEKLLDSLGCVQTGQEAKNVDGPQESKIISPKSNNMESSQTSNQLTAKKMRRRRRRKKQKDLRKINAMNKGKNINNTSKDIPVNTSIPVTVAQSSLGSRLIHLASSSNVTLNTADMEKKMRTSAEQQKKRRERLKQWHQSRKQDPKVDTRSGKGYGVTSPGGRITDGKDFEKDDYLEAPMDVESDTPDGPVLPLIEETGDDAAPPPPPPLPSREQELMALLQQQQLAYNSFSIQNLLNQGHVSPNIHGFYPPGQIIYGDWPKSYALPSVNRDAISEDVPASSLQEGDCSPSLQEHSNEGQVPPTAAETQEEEDDEAALLREILLKSVAKKRAARSNDLKDIKSQSAPPSPRPATLNAQSCKPTVSEHKFTSINASHQKTVQQPNTSRKVPLQPPQHDPVVIHLGQDSDSDYSDEEVYQKESTQQREGFFGSLDMMLKQARNSVENSKPKPDAKNEDTKKPIEPKTPDALAHLTEEKRAEYRRLKEQLAQHEGRKRQPLSDISQDKEAKSESDTAEEKMDSVEESRELVELKEKVKVHEEKLSKHRKSLSEDQEMLAKMTSMLSEKTSLLEVQETRVAKLKKQLEVAQKAMLNNRLVIKKLHEKAIKVKDRMAKRITITSNIEEDLLRVKSMVSAVRKDPSFYIGSDSNENKDKTHPAQNLKGTAADRVEGLLKRSLDDSTVGNSKKAKTEALQSQSTKSSPRKSLIAERIAQEKARLKLLEQELAERLSQFTKSPSKIQPNESTIHNESTRKQSEQKQRNTDSKMNEESVSKPSEQRPQNSNPGAGQNLSTQMEVQQASMDDSKIEFNIDEKQLDYIKKLQAEKEKKGPSFPKSPLETPQSIHRRTALCIWLETNKASLPVLDVNPSSLEWLGSSSISRENVETEELEELNANRGLSLGSYESVLLYFRSYRLSPYFRTKAGLSLSSLTFTNKLNPCKSLCDYELKGACNDEECKHQHQRDYTPNDNEAMKDLAAYAMPESEKLSQTATEEKINSLVEKFTNQYKNKISKDQLLVLLVNSIKKHGKKNMPFNIRSSTRPMSVWQQQQPMEAQECSTADRGRGIKFERKDERKMRINEKSLGSECQEIRYFSEFYNSIKTLTDAVEESPSDIALWIKLSRLQLHQRNNDQGGDDNEEQDMGLMQSLNTLSRGLEANPNSEELWLEYLKLFRLQGHSDEHKELCEQAIGFTPTYDIWWHYLDSVNNYNDKQTISLRLINHLAKQEQEQMDELHSHRLLESLLYLVQLELYTGRHKLALLAFQLAIGKKRPVSNDENGMPKLTSKILAHDLCFAWLAYIHVLEFHRLPATWFDPKHGYPTRMVAKETFVFPWRPGGGTWTPSEKILGMFHEALRACTLRNKGTSNKITLCLPLYQNLLALERAHGRLDSAKGICRRLLQGTTGQVELWQCLVALEETTGNSKQALVVLNEGLKKCGYDWEMTYTTARLYLEQGDPSKAVETLVSSINSRYLDPNSTAESPQSILTTGSSTVDSVLLFRKLLSQPLPYDSKPPHLISGVEEKPTGRDELYLWLSYCLLLELSPGISPLCLQYSLSAESAYETAVHTIINRSNVQAIWLEYLFYKTSRVLPSNTSDYLKPLDDLVNRCLMSVSASRTLPYSTSDSWLDYSFYNQVINLYLGCLPQSLWSAVYTKYLKLYPSNLQLAVQACEHEVSLGCIDQAIKIAAAFLVENPSSITMWKILISLNLQRSHKREAHKLYQQSTEILPFAATLWKDFIMFEIVQTDDKSSVVEIIKNCENVGINIKDYLSTLQGK